METAVILDILKHLPDGISLLVLIVVLTFTFVYKRKDIDNAQVRSVSELQTTQLTTLIKQNTELQDINAKLSQQLFDVRSRLNTSISEVNALTAEVQKLRESLDAATLQISELKQQIGG